MAKKNLCAMIEEELHTKVCEERDKAGMTNGEYVTMLLTEYYTMKENGGNTMAQESGKTRTMAFQISEGLFQRIKEHLERETKRLGYKVTQKDFVIGLIEAALAEAEQEDTQPPAEADEPQDSKEEEVSAEPEASNEDADGAGNEADSGQPPEAGETDTTGE